MTELVNKIKKKSRKINANDLNALGEMLVLSLTFLFCIYAVSPIV